MKQTPIKEDWPSRFAPVFAEYDPPKLLWPGEVSDPRDEADDLADSVDRLLTVRYCLRASESAGDICICSKRVTILSYTSITLILECSLHLMYTCHV